MDEFEKVNELKENETDEEKTAETVIDNEEVSEQTESVIDEDVENAEETSETEADEAEADEIDDSDEEDEEETPEKPKKPFIIERTIIKSFCVFLAALIAFGAGLIVKAVMTPGIEGIWVLKKVYLKSDPKQAQKFKTTKYDATYYNFKSDKTFELVSGSITQKAKWTYADSSGKAVDGKDDVIILYSGKDASQGSQLSWTVDGSAFSDKTLKVEAGNMYGIVQVYEFSSYSGSEIPMYQVKPDKNFKPVKEFVGTWEDSENKRTMELKEDGTYVINENNSLIQKGNYSVDTKKKTMTITYYSEGMQSNPLTYTFKDNKLTLPFGEFVKTK